MIDFWVAGIPAAQPRPRAYRRGERAAVYNPKTTDKWRGAVQASALEAGARPMAGALEVHVVFLQPIKSTKRQGRLKDTKPDVDNLAKAVLDALNGIAYADDGQVARLIVEKYYSSINQAGAQIRLEEVAK